MVGYVIEVPFTHPQLGDQVFYLGTMMDGPERAIIEPPFSADVLFEHHWEACRVLATCGFPAARIRECLIIP
jgi:hypothetical protein